MCDNDEIDETTKYDIRELAAAYAIWCEFAASNNREMMKNWRARLMIYAQRLDMVEYYDHLPVD